MSIRGTLAVALVALACGTGPTDPWVSLITQTESTEYELAEGTLVIPFTVTNASTETTFYLAACGEIPTILVDRRDGSSWASQNSGFCLANLSMAPVPLGPGERHEGAVAIGEPGVYRLRLGISTDRGQPSEWTEVSNSFVIR